MANDLATIKSDLERKALILYESKSGASILRALASDGASAVLLFRVSESLYSRGLVPLGFALSKLNKVLNGVVIGRGATIGSAFVMQHPIGVVINGSAVIGDRCTLQSGVTIGAHSVELRQTPRIGDDVNIGSGAKLIGDIKVGNGAQIGANAVVVDDVEAGVTAVGIPAKPLPKTFEPGSAAS